jgi:autotransporter-associated beta strand protein
MKTQKHLNTRTPHNKTPRFTLLALTIVIALFAAVNARAASQTWSNAPTDVNWTTAANWVGNAVPGTAGGNSAVPDTATFISPLPLSGIGGVTAPLIYDANRSISNIVFDTTDVGAYQIGAVDGVNDNSILYVAAGSIGGSIVMNTAVTNAQSFIGIVRGRLPGSANGTLRFTNNATSSAATLFFRQIYNESANTRPLDLILDGSNTGTNTIAQILDNVAANGAILIDKGGAGTWILSGPNELPQKTSASVVARVAVNQGTLVVQDPASLGSITVGNLTVTNGTLRIDNVTLNNNGITVRNGGIVRMNGSGAVNITVANQAANNPTLSTTGSNDVLTVGKNANNQLTGGAADSVLHIAGPGTVSLAFDANYVGKWSVDAGKLAVASPNGLGTGANLNIAAGGTVDATTLTGGGATYTLGTAALSATGTGTNVGSTAAALAADPTGIIDLATGNKPIVLTFTPTSFNGDTTHPALYVSQGTLSLNANNFTVNNAAATPLGAGTYTLIRQATGNITTSGSYSAVVTGTGLAAGTVASVQVVNGNVNLVVISYTSKNLVWTGGNPDGTWDTGTTANWLNGISTSVFNLSDSVTFNAVGSTNPTVTLSGALSPGSVTVDTSSNTYTFAGSGQIAGATSLVKKSPGTLQLQTVNAYVGGTVISNGVIQIGVNNAIPSTGAGNVAIYSPGSLDLNTFNDTINALNGNGTVDSVAGGASVLTVGNNNNNGLFLGTIQNTTGTVGLTKAGNGVQTLASSNSYTGPTIVNAGTLSVSNYFALGAGASPVTINAGTLDLATNVVIGTLGGNGGTIANNSTTVTNTLFITGNSTYGGVIANGSGSGRVSVLVLGGTLTLNSANTYSLGTFVATNAGLSIGAGSANAGTGGIFASNNTTLRMPNTGSSSSAPGNAITTANGATVTFTSGTTANNWGGQFNGSATATNIFTGGNMSIGATYSFSNFLGTVIITNGTVRMGPGTGFMGGDNTTFVFLGGGGMYTRDAGIVRLGALFGNGRIDGPSNPLGTYWIGAKNIDSLFSGNISGQNNIVKVGTARLTLNNTVVATNTDAATYTNYLYSPSLVNYTGSTVISNGVLALAAPVTLSTTPSITLSAATAVLDASQMGYISNFTDINSNPNSVLVTNGLFELLVNQSLRGIGTIRGSLLADSGSILTVGLPLGSLTVSNSAELAGAVNMCVNATNTPNTAALLATNFIIDASASLVVTNLGPEIAATFQLFNRPVNFPSVTLPTLSGTNSWVNNLNGDGSIKLLAAPAVATNRTNLVASVSSGNLSLTWPADHLGWTLQTNAVGLASTNSWFAYPGSATVTNVVIPINASLTNVFFRMSYP